MTYTELKDKINYYNAIHTNARFSYNPDSCTLLVGAYENPFGFTPSDYKDALDFIEEYGMLKDDKDCFGKELYYKGFKWEELNDAQRESVIDLYKGYDNLSPESEFAELFNDNRAFLYF